MTSNLKTIRLCLHWPTFGPYHIARLQAARELGKTQGCEVHALETAGRDQLYHWGEGETADPNWHCLFPDASFQDLDPREVRRRVFRVLDDVRPDGVAISSYSFPDARACLEWCRKNRKVAVLVTDTREDDVPRAGWREKLKARIVSQYDSAFLSGSPHRRYFEKLGFPADRVRIGCSVVDNDYFAAAPVVESDTDLPGIEDGKRCLLASSRFIVRKNLFFLLDAYRRYRADVESPWNLVILGDGRLEQELRKHIADNEIEGVHLPGFRSHREILRYYASAAAFVHPALSEQWGLVINEAMAAGLPIIVTNTTGSAEDLVADGVNGFTFHPTDDDALVRALTTIHGDPELRDRMSAASRERIGAWSLERYSEALFDAFEIGRERSTRGLAPDVRLILFTLRIAARSMDTFHAVEA
jgi:1,2-diacylglycerol 3-alpha-glucosyltransferase